MDYLKIYEEEHVKNGLSYSEIRKKYNIPRGTWDYHVRQLGGKGADLRKYRCNDSFFDIIDSEIKAYLLGFLYADGYISKDGRIGVLINEKDVYIVELIQQFIAPNSEIKHVNYQNFKRDPQVKIRFKSKRLYEKLVEFGFTIDKTHTECDILSKVPDDYKRHFIRGFCDGDGSIRYEEHHSPYDNNIFWASVAITFCKGVKSILLGIKEYFHEFPAEVKEQKAWYVLSYYKYEYVNNICNILYNNCTYYLKRKYDKAMSIIKYNSNTELTREIKESLAA